jgi:two-component system sensor kinase FixL
MVPSPGDHNPTLALELRWFVFLRWMAAAVLILGSLVTAIWLQWSARHTVFVVVGLCILAYNTALWILFRQRAAALERPLRLQVTAWVQVVLDLVCITLLVLWTDGLGSPLLGLYLVHLAAASLLLPAFTSYIVAAAAAAMLFGGLVGTDQWTADRPEALMLGGWFLMMLLTAFVGTHLVTGIRTYGTRIWDQGRRTRAILDTAVDGIITIDEAGVVLTVNPAAERLFGHRADEMVGRNVSLLMPEPHRSQHDTYLADYRRTGQAKIIGIGREVVCRRRDGSVFPADLAVSEVDLGDRRIFTGLVRDISDRKQAESRVSELNLQLEQQQEAMIQHEKMTAMGQMAAGVAHEIANPLASMDGLLQLVMRHPERLDDDTGRVLRDQVARINRIVRDLTRFAHPGDGEWSLVRVNDLVEDALGMMRFDHRMRAVEVEMRLSSEAGTVEAVPSSIQQVVVNLVVNALDAMADATDGRRLVVSTGREGDWCLIEVQDSGHGIAAEDLDRVFEPFFTTKPVGQGTGLGLSVSYSLVRRHGGRCEVTSESGRWTRFVVRLPAAGGESRVSERSGGAIPESGNDPRQEGGNPR